jgi:catechol 2,3-dioxygenase-like lactoylglutathione lyase family enzyme
MIGAMRLATLGVSDMEQALSLFRNILELKVESDAAADPSLLAAWKLPPGTSARLVELSCKGYPIGRVRLAQFTPLNTQRVRMDHGTPKLDTGTDIGIKAVDFYVEDPILPRVKQIEAAGYVFRSPPVKHQIADTVSEECLFSGPDGVPILIMVGHVHGETSKRKGSPDGPFSEVPTISIVCGDLEKTRQFWGRTLGLKTLTDAETPPEYRDLVDDLTGVPHGTRIHFLMFGGEDEASGKILNVHFFERTGKRLDGRMKPGHLGFSLLTHDTKDIDAVHRAVLRDGFAVETPPTAVRQNGESYRLMLVRGPSDELVEIVEQ